MLTVCYFLWARVIFHLFHNTRKLFSFSSNLGVSMFRFVFIFLGVLMNLLCFGMFAWIFFVSMNFLCLFEFHMLLWISYVSLKFLCFREFNMFQCSTSKCFCFLIPNTWSSYEYFCVETSRCRKGKNASYLMHVMTENYFSQNL